MLRNVQLTEMELARHGLWAPRVALGASFLTSIPLFLKVPWKLITPLQGELAFPRKTLEYDLFEQSLNIPDNVLDGEVGSGETEGSIVLAYVEFTVQWVK